MEPETYLGDGLYASFDGYQIRLRAPRAGGDHEVFLEPAAWQKLRAFVAHKLLEATAHAVQEKP